MSELTPEMVREFRGQALQSGPGIQSFAIRLLAEDWLRLHEENETLRAGFLAYRSTSAGGMTAESIETDDRAKRAAVKLCEVK